MSPPSPAATPPGAGPPPIAGTAGAGGSTDRGGRADAPVALGRGTLGRQLVIRVSVLVALVALLLGGATLLATYTLLIDQVDEQLAAVTGRVRGDPDDDRRGPVRRLLQPGQPIGTLVAQFDEDGRPLGSGQLGEHGHRPALPPHAIATLFGVPTDGRMMSIGLPGLGRYRVVGYEAVILTAAGPVRGTVVVGVPLGEVERTLVKLVGLEVVLAILVFGATIVAVRTLVERSLRPLNRVAALAQHVSAMPLDRGEVALAVRVPDEDANPTSEVGRVGLALNHMLSNVAGALTARQTSEMKVRQFVADASHELRNPLAAIRGYAELTRRRRAEMPPDAAYAMERVESETERMSRLVEDMLLLARLDSGPDLDPQPTDLSEIVINAVSDARAAGRDHVWTLDLPEEPVVAIGDAHRLHQVVANLLANARTHTPPGTKVETGLAVRDGQAVITVTDDGPGIPEDLRDRVFERFTRADSSRVRSAGAAAGASTGLGLAIVAAVVEAHRGRVSVKSRPGRTRFSIFLPLAA
jgi:two-component system, OmpR family, sensor kinase